MMQVVEEAYTVREARIHVRHVRDLLKSADNADAYAGVDCASLSFLNTVCQGDAAGNAPGSAGVNGSGGVGGAGGSGGGNNDARKRVPSNNNSSNGAIDCTPPDFLLPGASASDRCETFSKNISSVLFG